MAADRHGPEDDRHDFDADAVERESTEDDFIRKRMDASTAAALRRLLAGHRGEPAPPLEPAFAALAAAHTRRDPTLAWAQADSGVRPEDLADPEPATLVDLLASSISPAGGERLPGADPGAPGLAHTDWLTLLVRLIQAGPGAGADATSLRGLAEAVSPARTHGGWKRLERRIAAVLPVWQALGVLDDELRLTDAGVWLLPRAACAAWGSDFDDPESVDGPGTWEVPIAEEPPELDDAQRAAAATVVDRLSSAGALDLGTLQEAVHEGTGQSLDQVALRNLLFDLPEIFSLRDGRWIHLPSLLDGVVVTHRLAEVEVELQALLIDPDLYCFVWVVGDLPFHGGGTVGVRYRRGHPLDVHDALVGPEGWLTGHAAGDLVAVRVQDGAVSVSRISQAELDVDAAARTADRLAEVHDTLGGTNVAGGPLDVPELLLETLARAPRTLARPQPPLGELLEMADLVEEAGAVVAAEDDTAAAADGDGMLREVYGLDDTRVEAHHRILAVLAEVAEDGLEVLDAEDLDELAAALADAALAESVADRVATLGGSTMAVLRHVALALDARGRGRTRAGLAYLRARTAEHFGETEEAEALLDEALAADPGCTPALLDAAWYAEDRGNAARALSLLHRAGLSGDDAQLERLEGWAAPAARVKVGRNDPCPCGSGRKYKVCCLRSGGHPLTERAGWLLDKLETYVHRPSNRSLVLLLVEARAGDAPDPYRLFAAMRDSLVFDLAAFEEGLLEDFLDERGVLLPADELALGREWLGARRSVYEVVAVRPGEGLTLLDLRSGDTVDVAERLGSRSLRSGEAVFARVLPVGGRHILTAANVRIAVQHREPLLALLDTDPGGVAQAAWVAALEAPPRMVTMEGEPTVFCEATYALDDADEARRVLDARYEREEEDTWVEMFDTETGRWRRGTVTIEGSRLIVRTNSVPRLVRFQAVIAEALSGAELVDEERRPLAEVVTGPGDLEEAGVPFEDLPPELAEELDAMVRAQEERWLDESIPALGGLTPREAAADPTRRGQLQALLDELDAVSLPGPARGMDAGRLRARLGFSGPSDGP